MKKVYIPTMNELDKLQSLGANIYGYLVAKVIETLIIEDVLYEESDMFEVAYEHLSEIPEIIYALGRIYPEKIKDNTKASNDVNLCISLTSNIPKPDKSIYGLDNLVYFQQDYETLSETSPLCNPKVILNTARILADKLISCPRYRFDYQYPNILLDSIFSCELPSSLISSESLDYLATIDPIYTTDIQIDELSKKDKQSMLFALTRNIIKYEYRYGLPRDDHSEYQMKDILSKPNDKVKKLIKCLDYHKNNYQL